MDLVLTQVFTVERKCYAPLDDIAVGAIEKIFRKEVDNEKLFPPFTKGTLEYAIGCTYDLELSPEAVEYINAADKSFQEAGAGTEAYVVSSLFTEREVINFEEAVMSLITLYLQENGKMAIRGGDYDEVDPDSEKVDLCPHFDPYWW